jgi:hypothetical protein
MSNIARNVTLTTVRILDGKSMTPGSNYRYLLGRPMEAAELVSATAIPIVHGGQTVGIAIVGTWKVDEGSAYNQISDEYERAGKSPSDVAAETGDIPLDPIEITRPA